MLSKKLFLRTSVYNKYAFSHIGRYFATENDAKVQGGYAKAYDKFENLKGEAEDKKPETFASLLRSSKFIDVSSQFSTTKPMQTTYNIQISARRS